MKAYQVLSQTLWFHPRFSSTLTDDSLFFFSSTVQIGFVNSFLCMTAVQPFQINQETFLSGIIEMHIHQ